MKVTKSSREKTRVVRDAVSGEPVSQPLFPVLRLKTGKRLIFQPPENVSLKVRLGVSRGILG